MRRILSNDLPRSRPLTALLLLVCIALVLVPVAFPSTKAINIAAKTLVFIVLVASFDLLLGYTGILSFAHTMFFGIGAYGIAIASSRLGPSWEAIVLGAVGAIVASIALALIISLFSLRIRAIFFAMVTLAVASSVQTLTLQMPDFTGGEDGITFRVPALISGGPIQLGVAGVQLEIDGRTFSYYTMLLIAAVLFLALLRIVNSPFGRVLQAVRENEFRCMAIGYDVLKYRTVASVLSAVFATVAGMMLSVWLRYSGPETTLNFEIMLDVILILVIGGMGTMYGAVLGSAAFMLAQFYLQSLLVTLSQATTTLPVFIQSIASPQRWLLWLGLIFIFTVYFLPSGITGRLRRHSSRSL